MLKFASFGEGGISRLFCLYVLVSVQRVHRADERTRTANLPITSDKWGLQGFARFCTSRISKRFSLLRVALCCTVLRSRWCQSGVKTSRITRGGCLLIMSVALTLCRSAWETRSVPEGEPPQLRSTRNVGPSPSLQRSPPCTAQSKVLPGR